MSNGISYGIKAPGFDPTAGFRKELQKVEQQRAEKESKALEMAAMIEMADQSTMFGSDYSIANQWAEHLTENLDKYASSTDGMIKFQQQAQQLTKFIDGAEAYKKENFGTVKDGAQAGTFQGFVQRKALGENVYGDLEDEREDQSYEMAYMGLNQPVQLNWDADDNPVIMSNGKPVSFGEYRRPDAPFMPQLKEGKILMGSTWYADKGPNRAHETSDEAYEYALKMTQTDPKLERQAARYYQMEEKPSMSVDEILGSEENMDQAREMWAQDAKNGWIDYNKKTAQKATAGQIKKADNLESLFQSVKPIVEEGPLMPGESLSQQINFSPSLIKGKVDLTNLIPDRLKVKKIRNPEYDPENPIEFPEYITAPTSVEATPSNMSLLEDGRIRLSSLGNAPSGEAIPDIYIDPNTNEGREVMSEIDAMFREEYPVSLRDFINSLKMTTESPEIATETTLDKDPLGLGL